MPPATPPGATPPPPRKKKNGLLIALAIVLVVAIAGALAWFIAGRDIKRLLLGNKRSYVLIEGQQLKTDAADLAADLTDWGLTEAVDPVGGQLIDFQVDISDKLAAGKNPTTVAALEGMTFKIKSMYDRKSEIPQYFNQLDIMVQGQDKALLTVETFYNTKQLIVGFPGLLDSYLKATDQELTDTLSNAGAGSTTEMNALGRLLGMQTTVSEKDLVAGMNKLIDAFLKNTDKATFERGYELEVGDVKKVYDCYTVTTTGAKARQMMIEMLTVLRDEKVFYELYSQMAAASAGTSGEVASMTEQQWQTELSSTITSLETGDRSQDNYTLTQKIYVDKKDVIHGREFMIEDDAGKPVLQYRYFKPVSGDQAGALIAVVTPDGSFEYVDEYTMKSGKQSGNLTIKTDGQQVLGIEYQDYAKEKSGDDQYMTGKYKIKLSPVNASTTPVSDISFTATLSGKRYQMEIAIGDYVNVSMGYEKIAAKDVTMPDYSGKTLISMSDTEALQGLMGDQELMGKLQEIMTALGFNTGITG